MDLSRTPRIVPRAGGLLAIQLNTSAARLWWVFCRRTGSDTSRFRPPPHPPVPFSNLPDPQERTPRPAVLAGWVP